MSNVLTPSASAASDEACHVCGQPTLREVPAFSRLRRVTSDCRAWHAGGRLNICGTCGCVQKPVDAAFLRETAAIYASYAIYHQSGGEEQAVFDALGRAVTRSSRLVAALRSHVPLPAKGRLLDVGCGNGATLRAFSEAEPDWGLAGSELDERHRGRIESISRVEAFYTCAIRDVPGCFDVVTMVHVLEHVPRPVPFLAEAWSRLAGGGLLVVEIPDYTRNPFDVLVADHCTHFSAATAALTLQLALNAPAFVAEDWVPKELTLVARAAPGPPPSLPTVSPSSTREAVEANLDWLFRTIASARRWAKQGCLGLFGTSIAATWLFAELEGTVSFFVDEDPNRVGTVCLGRPVYHPSQVPAGSHVFLALPSQVAKTVCPRMAREDVVYHLPPER